LRTGSRNQNEIAIRFGITVKPAPDFVVFEQGGVLRGMLECKAATMEERSRQGRTISSIAYRGHAARGVPLFAVLADSDGAHV